eukprot:CAMPEP_0201634476 /NCGR_PEP_ID=MMETSP0493-20130528/7391_1 /ASSEMBLY_ACC=CAM_ASM_000838 /TAXON_ID=420259 /ORGANISM="Thalassiosira gravida, Strain GMp14c1" /LENGTH=52 /DNA_ID=CAMNT_0048106329 /DNA_START=242 /DNA_END=400 /DNA_ORIENTATION=+
MADLNPHSFTKTVASASVQPLSGPIATIADGATSLWFPHRSTTTSRAGGGVV